ncbi:MAG: hypothetical protein L3J67_12385 [Hyphomicrobiaceae bacterium]|nr:hypothetical protein [Hyphomicrobiaceae bacterium]
MTSLADDRLDPELFLQLARDHWQVENHLHYVKDVTVGEEACRVRSGSAPQVLAQIRNAVLTMIRKSGQERKWSAIKLITEP